MSAWIPREGLRFECTSCGACCTGPPGYVRYTPEEGAALAARFDLDVEQFEARYTRDTVVGRSLIEVETEHGYDCVFLDRDTIPGKAICSVYEDRPLQCRTFPWWPEHLGSDRSWSALGRACEGVGRGDFVPIEDIRASAQRQASRDADVSR